jgi:hypothetical protein
MAALAGGSVHLVGAAAGPTASAAPADGLPDEGAATVTISGEGWPADERLSFQQCAANPGWHPEPTDRCWQGPFPTTDADGTFSATFDVRYVLDDTTSCDWSDEQSCFVRVADLHHHVVDIEIVFAGHDTRTPPSPTTTAPSNPLGGIGSLVCAVDEVVDQVVVPLEELIELCDPSPGGAARRPR